MRVLRSVLPFLLACTAQLAFPSDWTVSGMADLPVLDPTGRWATDLGGKTWRLGTQTLHPVRNQVFQTGGSEAPNGRFTLDGNGIVRAYPDKNFVRTIDRIDAVTGIPVWTVLRPGINKVIGVLDNGTEFVTQENSGTTVRSLLTGAVVRSFTFDSSVAFGHYSAVRDAGYRWIVYDLNDGSIKYQKQTSVDPRGSVFSENNRYMFHQWGQTQYIGEVLDLATGASVPVPYRGSASAVSNDGQWVLQRDITALYWTNVVSQQTVALPCPSNPAKTQSSPMMPALYGLRPISGSCSTACPLSCFRASRG